MVAILNRGSSSISTIYNANNLQKFLVLQFSPRKVDVHLFTHENSWREVGNKCTLKFKLENEKCLVALFWNPPFWYL